ncbi:regulator of sigma E protease [Geothermobacter ehrlichii]|uniref:Zinc metalloprotease n=1 Tax=Geothermobacter ehrlichii TaxID=213224 RepID=A0A5D3WM08_9BACT|nr:RIP metalloprotease RseP [Geothermobacter ehrlichii]TYO99533.1 regulator of sigma E protease [Geothermobacter ehrlichii]
MIYLVSGIIMLGILIFVHEFGHFCVAKWSGVKVLKFSLGFGPKIVSRQWGETVYQLSLIPLGGYVQMLGEGSGQGDEQPVDPADRGRSFAEKPLARRTAIVAAGPLMNLLLPFVLLPVAYMIGVNVPAFLDRKPCAGYVYQESPAARAGFRAGDCILAIDGKKVESWNEANQALVGAAGGHVEVRILRAGEEKVLALSADVANVEDLQLRNLGIFPVREAVVGAVMKGLPAEEAGLRAGDRILAIDGTPVRSWYDLTTLIQQGGGQTLSIRLQRGDREFTVELKPEKQPEQGRFLIGIEPQVDTVFKKYGPVDAIDAGFDQAMEIISLTLVFIQKLFSGQVSTQNIGGPIMVFQMAGQAAQTGVTTVLTMLAFLSIQLGILNLLPIPILDGGHLFFYFCEFVFRKPLSMRARELAQQIGLALLIMLMILAFYNDINRMDWVQKFFGLVFGG